MGTILVLCILAVIVGMIVRSMYKDKQQGRACGDCTGCAGCRMQGKCASRHGKGNHAADTGGRV